MNFIKYWEFDAVNLNLVTHIEIKDSVRSFVINFFFSKNDDYVQWNFIDKEERNYVYKIIMNNISSFPIQAFEEDWRDK